MTLYWVVGRVTYKATGIPDDAVPFSVGAGCPCGKGYISEIYRDSETYRCMTTDLSTRTSHEGFPLRTVAVAGTSLIVNDREIGQLSEFRGVAHRE